MDIQTLNETKNKKGKLLNKTVRITSKKAKEGLTFDDINALYNKLSKKYKPEDIKIIGRTFDSRFNKLGKETNYITLKNKNYKDENLKYDNENYQSNQPKEIMDKITGLYYSIDIEIDF